MVLGGVGNGSFKFGLKKPASACSPTYFSKKVFGGVVKSYFEC